MDKEANKNDSFITSTLNQNDSFRINVRSRVFVNYLKKDINNKIMKNLLSILVLSLLLSTNTIMASEEVEFDIVHKTETYEIRKYSERLCASN